MEESNWIDEELTKQERDEPEGSLIDREIASRKEAPRKSIGQRLKERVESYSQKRAEKREEKIRAMDAKQYEYENRAAPRKRYKEARKGLRTARREAHPFGTGVANRTTDWAKERSGYGRKYEGFRPAPRSGRGRGLSPFGSGRKSKSLTSIFGGGSASKFLGVGRGHKSLGALKLKTGKGGMRKWI